MPRSTRVLPLSITAVLFLGFSIVFAAGLDELVRVDRSGRVVKLSLHADLGKSWRDAAISRLAVRTNQGERRLDFEPLPRSATLDLEVPAKDCSLVIVEGLPRLERKAAKPNQSNRSWQRASHSIKIVSCPVTSDRRADLETRRSSTGLMTSKVGSHIEIRPLFNPSALKAGSDLPLKLYWNGLTATSAQVVAAGPDGSIQTAESDRTGLATVHLGVPGRWVMRFQHGRSVAELSFDLIDWAK